VQSDDDLEVVEDAIPALGLAEADQHGPAGRELALQILERPFDHERRQAALARVIAQPPRRDAALGDRPEVRDDRSRRHAGPVRHDHADGGSAALGLLLLRDVGHVADQEPARLARELRGRDVARGAAIRRACGEREREREPEQPAGHQTIRMTRITTSRMMTSVVASM
jgi:hypothetical protein